MELPWHEVLPRDVIQNLNNLVYLNDQHSKDLQQKRTFSSIKNLISRYSPVQRASGTQSELAQKAKAVSIVA